MGQKWGKYRIWAPKVTFVGKFFVFDLEFRILKNGASCTDFVQTIFEKARFYTFFFSIGGLLGRAAAGLSRIGDAGVPKIRKKDQNRVKNEFFLTFQNGPKWIKVTFKWCKMAPKRIFG